MADWPLTSDLGPLGALPTAPRLARGFIGVVLNGWGLGSLIETTELVVSEYRRAREQSHAEAAQEQAQASPDS